MRKSLLALTGCVVIMGTVLSGCGKDTGSVSENGSGAGTAPEEAGENGTGANVPDGSSAKEKGGMKDGGSEDTSQDAAQITEGAAEASNNASSEIKNGEDTITVTQGGPFGAISLTLPVGWKYELCPMDSDSLLIGDYGIYFSPEDTEFGFVEVAYMRSFGVCGTGLTEEEVTIAGHSAWKGTYDDHGYWDFISFQEPMKDVVAMTSNLEEWWEGNEDTVMEILDTVTFDPNVREGGAYVYEKESENSRIGLHFYLEGISSTGAMLCYSQYDKEAPTGQLQDGDDFVIEVKKEGSWEEAAIVVEGNYGFHDIAYVISPGETTRRQLNWKWLYGELEPGEYRIRKSVIDFRKTGDYDKYEIYAHFILN